MATRKRKNPIPRAPNARQVTLYLREWRKFMGVSAPTVALALGIERESYLKMERETWRASYAEAIIIADTIGVRVSQLRFPPPPPGQEPILKLDEIFEDIPEDMRPAAFLALRGMAGKGR